MTKNVDKEVLQLRFICEYYDFFALQASIVILQTHRLLWEALSSNLSMCGAVVQLTVQLAGFESRPQKL